VAGHRRRRLESGERPELPEFPEPPKPLMEMTPAERAAYTAQLRRALRDDEIRRARRPLKTAREFEIWHEALAAKDEQTAARIARADRRQRRLGTSDTTRPVTG
jgi:hypothetical protein